VNGGWCHLDRPLAASPPTGRAAGQVHGMFGFVRQVRAAIPSSWRSEHRDHTGSSFLIGTLLLPPAASNRASCRRVGFSIPARLGQTLQILVIFLAVIPPHQRPQCRRWLPTWVAIDGNRLPLHQPFLGQGSSAPTGIPLCAFPLRITARVREIAGVNRRGLPSGRMQWKPCAWTGKSGPGARQFPRSESISPRSTPSSKSNGK